MCVRVFINHHHHAPPVNNFEEGNRPVIVVSRLADKDGPKNGQITGPEEMDRSLSLKK